MTHKIKIYEPYADAVADGRKTFEVRHNDRGYNAGDLVMFTVLDKQGIPLVTHPLHSKLYEITYVHSGMGLEKDYVVFSMREVLNEQIR